MSEIKLFVATSTIVHEIPKKTTNFKKDIQALFEKHLDTLLNIHFVCSEFLAGDGRIDTLGLDEKNSPVIIEYKRNMTSHGISRGLSYMDWLMDHRNDFYVKVLREIDRNMADSIDWSSPRLICVAEDFEKYDIRAANRMDNVDLIRYKKYGDELVLLEFMNRFSSLVTMTTPNPSDPKPNHLQSADSLLKASHQRKNRPEINPTQSIMQKWSPNKPNATRYWRIFCSLSVPISCKSEEPKWRFFHETRRNLLACN